MLSYSSRTPNKPIVLKSVATYFLVMFSMLSLTLTVYLIMLADTLLGLTESEVKECEKQETYAIAPQITQPLTIKLYYHAGRKLETDNGYLKAMGTAIAAFPHVTFNFFVGEGVKKGENGPECVHVEDAKNKDCTYNYEHACASQLVNFNTWVGCVVNGGSGADCISSQDGTKLKEFNQCVQLKDPKIRPDQILLNNANAASQINNPSGYVPILLFNDKLDDCARWNFYKDPVKVINALLKGK